METVWPQRILDHPSGSTISIGDLTGSSLAMGLGNKVMTGLRVRMGINTGRHVAGMTAEQILHHDH